MKNYRSAIADARVLAELLEYLSGRADDHLENFQRYTDRSIENPDENGTPDDYWASEAAESKSKAEAFERLIAKLSK